MSKLMRNKKADLAVTLLIFMAVALATATIFIFINSSGKIEAEITDARFLDKIYAKEEILNFYINEIMENTIKTTKESAGFESNFEKDFPTNFLGELEKYKINGKFILEELQQVQAQVYENSNVFIFEKDAENAEKVKKVTAEFQITLEDNVAEEKELFSAVYIYTKKFEKEIKKESSNSVSIEETTSLTSLIVSADLTKKVEIPGSNTMYDGYYIYVDGERTEYFLIKTLNGYTIMKEGSGDNYAHIEEDKDWRIVTYPNKPLPEYLQGKKFVKEGDIIYFKDD